MFEEEKIEENGVHLLTRYWPCPNCEISGAFEEMIEDGYAAIKCNHCKLTFVKDAIKPVYRLPKDKSTPAEDRDMLEHIFVMNKVYTDFVRDNVTPREDLAENVIMELIKICKTKGANFSINGMARYEKAVIDLRMTRNAIAIQGEAAEYMDEMPWKWWGRGVHEIEKRKAIMELIDIMHFMMVAFDDLGVTPREIYDAYVAKHIENRVRYFEKKGWGDANR